MDPNSDMYKKKYLKYKSKYLQLQQSTQTGSGIFTEAFIITRLETIKSLNTQLQSDFNELKINVKCTDFENLVRSELGMNAHIMMHSDSNFVKFTNERSICRETQLKNLGSNVGTQLHTGIKELQKVAAPIVADIKKTAETQIKQASAVVIPKITQSIQTGIIKAIEQGTKSIDKAIDKANDKNTKLKFGLTTEQPQTGGSSDRKVDIVIGMIERGLHKRVEPKILEQIVNDNKYDIVIHYEQQIMGKSKLTIIKL